MPDCNVSLNNDQCWTVRFANGGTIERDRFKTKCYICGNDACPACSAIVKYLGKSVRACADCIHERRDDRDLVVRISEEIRLGIAKDAMRDRERRAG